MVQHLGFHWIRSLLVSIHLYRKGFKKVDLDRWEFANEGFIRGQKHLLKSIKRRKPLSHPSLPPHQPPGPLLEVGGVGSDGEIVDRLRNDKNILLVELMKLRQEQQNTRSHLKAMEVRLQRTERNQRQMMTFLSRAMQNPDFINQLVQQKDRRKELDGVFSKKRRRQIDRRLHHGDAETSKEIETLEAHEFQGFYGYEFTELESLALEIQGFGRCKGSHREHEEQDEEKDERELNDEFWEELLNDGIDEENSTSDLGGVDDEGVTMLADRLGYLNSMQNG